MRIRRLQLAAIVSLAPLIGMLQGVALAQAAPQTIKAMPDQRIYRFLLRKAAAFNDRANLWDAQGKNGNGLRSIIKTSARMSDADFQTFNQVALEHEQEVKNLDARAMVLLDAYRAQYPGGVVPHGQKPAPVPVELKILQAEKDAITSRSIERLKASLSSEAFAGLDSYARRTFRQNLPGVVAPPATLNLIPADVRSFGGQQ